MSDELDIKRVPVSSIQDVAEILSMKKHNYNRPLPPNPYNPLSWIHPATVIGDNCWIGSDVVITSNVELADNVSISCGCKIYDHDASWYRVSEGRIEAKHYNVKIGRCTQVGSNTVICATDGDITIGDHCIIGALSYVRRSVPAYTVAAGNPLRIVRHINEDVVNEKMRKMR